MITPETVFTEIQKVIQSHDNFILDDGLKVHVLICDPLSGTGPKRKYSEPDKDFAKRSCKQICDSIDDYLCLSRAIIVGKALADFPDPLRQSPSTGIREEQTLLHIKAEIPEQKRLYSLEDVDKFQNILKDKYRIFVFEKTDKIRCVYAGFPCLIAKNIFLLIKNHHYHLITDIQRFLPPKNYFCIPCCFIYSVSTSYKHASCRNICPASEHLICDSATTESDNKIKCDDCKRFWNTVQCFDNHKKNHGHRKKPICELLKCCESCQSTISRHLLDTGKHVCNETFCQQCRQKYVKSNQQHECCISPIGLSPVDKDFAFTENFDKDEYVTSKLGETKWRHFFFDIESDIVDDVHEPVLLIMQSDSCEEKIFFGRSCIDEFCEHIFQPSFEKLLFISHRGRGYDNFFPLNYCYKKNIKPKILFNGGKILVLEIPEYKIMFKDNLSFLTVPLAVLPKTMGLDIAVTKGFFPYEFPFPMTRNC